MVQKKRIITIGNSIVKTAAQIVEGAVNHITNNDLAHSVSKKRLEICGSCEYNGGITCNKCGCILELKTMALSASCPIKKWKELTKEEAEKYVSE